MLRHLALRACSVTVLLLLVAVTVQAANVPADFVVENAVPGVGFNNPVGLAFTPDGRILVAEKAGEVRVVDNGVKLITRMWDGKAEVLNKGDRGLLAIAVDPNYAENRYVYLLYSVNPDSGSSDNKDDAFGRLTRYQTSLANPNVLDPSTRTVLIGKTWRDGFPSGSDSHAVGSLRFGEDGSLLVSHGDGAQFTGTDAGGNDPGLFGPDRSDPAEDIGAFRAQYLGSLNGKLLRVDPANGEGYPSNPFYDGDPESNPSRVWANGLRNPFRFSVRPGTGNSEPAAGDPGTLYVGDVGLMTWEELNVVRGGGLNFGWPCYEGLTDNVAYQNANPAHSNCASIGSAQNPGAYIQPEIAIHHSDSLQSQPAGLKANCVIGGVFYSGGHYPPQYRDQLFFADFGQNWIKVGLVNANDEIFHVLNFATDADGPVDFALDPLSGDIHYLSIYTGKLFRIRYVGLKEGNAPPVAVAIASPTVGDAPLAVGFDGSGSLDPDGDPLTFQWNFGDGDASANVNVQHVYQTPGIFRAVLTVEDNAGNLARDTVSVVARVPFPATAVLDEFDRPDGPVGAPWVGSLSNSTIENGELKKLAESTFGVWDERIHSPNQEAFMVVGSGPVDSAQFNVILQVQGTSWTAGHVQVRFDAAKNTVRVYTYDPSALWVSRSSPFSLSFAAGDTLGGRVDAEGTVVAYKNSVEIGRTSVAGWVFTGMPGRIGFSLTGGSNVRLGRFGGGNTLNLPPLATIETPTDGTFFADGDTVQFSGSGSDDQDGPEDLQYQWKIDLHHNTHVHPESFVSEGPTASFIAHDHDDGTGVWLEAHFIVTDRGNKSDTTSIELYPEIDLAPSPVATEPEAPGTAAPAVYRFRIHNLGRMPAPFSRWRLLAGTTLLAEGDTLVQAMSNVEIAVEVAPKLAPGSYSLRVVVDTLAAVREMHEDNNAETRPLTVVEGSGVTKSPKPDYVLALSKPYPNPSPGRVSINMTLPRESQVEFTVYDVQGREVWKQQERLYGAGEWRLAWPGKLSNGDRARPGLYMARITAGGATFKRRIAMVR